MEMMPKFDRIKKMFANQNRILNSLWKSLRPPLNQNLSSARPRSEYFIRTNLKYKIFASSVLRAIGTFR